MLNKRDSSKSETKNTDQKDLKKIKYTIQKPEIIGEKKDDSENEYKAENEISPGLLSSFNLNK